jgi:hypothetical protein
MQAVFYGRQKMIELGSQIMLLQAEMATWRDMAFASQLDMSAALRALAAIRQQIMAAAPYCICGCSSPNDCPYCGGREWLTNGEYLTGLDLKRVPLSRASQPSSPAAKKSQDQTKPPPGQILKFKGNASTSAPEASAPKPLVPSLEEQLCG